MKNIGEVNRQLIENDIHERNYEFMRGVYDNAMQVSEYLNWDRIDCSAGDHLDTVENIHKKIYQKVKLLNVKKKLV